MCKVSGLKAMRVYPPVVQQEGRILEESFKQIMFLLKGLAGVVGVVPVGSRCYYFCSLVQPLIRLHTVCVEPVGLIRVFLQ